MSYKRYIPKANAAAFIECFWVVENDEATIVQQKIIPDGYSEIIFHHGDPYYILLDSNEWIVQPQQLLAGQIRKFFFLKNAGKSGILGIKFKPAALTHLFSLSMEEYVDKVVDLHLLDNEFFSRIEQLAKSAMEAGEKVAAIEHCFEAITANCAGNKIDEALDLIIHANGAISVSEITQKIFVTERQLERMFKRYIGLSPKYYARIIRFNYIFHLIENKTLTWTDLAYEAGYYDLSHFVREFRSFTGEDPSDYIFEEDTLANFFLQKQAI
jgi:AraC-like DNA-binding protein